MQFTQIPADYSPVGNGAVYAFETGTAADCEFRIVEAASGEVLGTKRFRNTVSGRFDIAPYLRERLCPTPTTNTKNSIPTSGTTSSIPTANALYTPTDSATSDVTGFIPTANSSHTLTVGATDDTKADATASVTASNSTGTPTDSATGPVPAVNPTAFTSPTRTSGFAPADGHSVTVRVETTGATAPARTFLPGTAAADVPEIRTTFPCTRLLGCGECDEVTLVTATACTATLVVRHGDTTEGMTFREEGAGVHLFRIEAAEFPGAEALTLAFDDTGTIEYRIVERPAEACRLAWVSQAGSVEHYTFPVVKACGLHAEKQRILGVAGLRTVACRTERRTTLLSAFEMPGAAEAVAGAIAAPQVWLAEADGSYTAVEVLTEEAAVQRHGTLCRVEVTFVSHPKTSVR